jgi:hypothetical protein
MQNIDMARSPSTSDVPYSGTVDARPSITEMVSHLKTSITMLEERIQGHDALIGPTYHDASSSWNGANQNSMLRSQVGSPSMTPRVSESGDASAAQHAPYQTQASSSTHSRHPNRSDVTPSRRPVLAEQRSHSSMHGELTSNVDLPASLGRSMASAVTRALGAKRFHVVRDSLNGELLDEAMQPPPRPLANSRNTLTV